jgi:hypothetical protein
MVDRPEPERLFHAELSRRNVRLGAIVVAVVIAGLGISLLRGSKPSGSPELTGALRQSLEQNGCTVDSRTDEGQAHVPAATYSVDPPAGGDHDSAPSPAGFYDVSNVPTDGHLVHSLEHGFVVVWYRPAGVPAATVDKLRDLAGRHRWVLVVPRPSMPTPLAATAWHRRLLCPDGADGPIGTFVTAFRDQGPEKGFV